MGTAGMARNFIRSHKRKNKVTTRGAEAERDEEDNNEMNNCAGGYAAVTPIHTAYSINSKKRINDKRGLSPQSKTDEKNNKRYN